MIQRDSKRQQLIEHTRAPVFHCMPDRLTELKLALDKCANPEKAAFYPRFFKTGKGEYGERAKIYSFTLGQMGRINNWDLVDCAGPKIVGVHMLSHPTETKKLYTWAGDRNLWTRRMSMMATFPFIRDGHFDHTLKIAERLVADEHDLIHKAVGWMLREVGNRDRSVERGFLDIHATTMPRTMLRYAIEKFPDDMRKEYLQR